MDDVAPLEWNRMQSSACQNDYYNKLSQLEQEAIDSWVQRRSSLIQIKSQSIITQRLENEPGMSWKHSRFIKLYVRALVTKGDNSRKRNEIEDCNQGMLTLWDPSEDQLNMLLEGNVLHFQNLAVKEKKVDNLLQLSIRGKANMDMVLPAPSPETLCISGYRKRKDHSLVQVHIESRKLNASSIQSPEYDLVGYLLKTREVIIGVTTRYLIYLIDQSGLVLRIERDAFSEKENELIHWKNNTHEYGRGLILHLFDIRIRPFDPLQGCAVGIWTKHSSCQEVKSNQKGLRVKDWSECSEGRKVCDFILNRMNVHIPANGKLPKQFAIIIGKLLGIRCFPELDDLEGKQIVNVDIGNGSAIELCSSLDLLTKVITMMQTPVDFDCSEKKDMRIHQDFTMKSVNESLNKAYDKDTFFHLLVDVTQDAGTVTQIKQIQNEHLITLQINMRPFGTSRKPNRKRKA